MCGKMCLPTVNCLLFHHWIGCVHDTVECDVIHFSWRTGSCLAHVIVTGFTNRTLISCLKLLSTAQYYIRWCYISYVLGEKTRNFLAVFVSLKIDLWITEILMKKQVENSAFWSLPQLTTRAINKGRQAGKLLRAQRPMGPMRSIF